MSRRSSTSSISTFSSVRDDDQMMRDCYELKKRLLQTQQALQDLGTSSFGSHVSSTRSSPRKKETPTPDIIEKDVPLLTLEDLSPKSSSVYSHLHYPSLEARSAFNPQHSENDQPYNSKHQMLGQLSSKKPNMNKRKFSMDRNSTNDSLLLAENDKLRLELESATFELQDIKAQLSNSQLCLEQSLRSSGNKKKRIRELEEKLQEALENLRNVNQIDTTLRRENETLRKALSKQEDVLRELETLCSNLQIAQRNFIQMHKAHVDGSEDSLDKSPTNQSAVFAIAELRLQLAKQEAENQRLQAALKAQGSSRDKQTQGGCSDVPAVSDIRSELTAVIERNRLGDRKQQELERIITYLEDEVARHTSRVLELEERLQDSNEARGKLEDKVVEKGAKVAQLQKELDSRASEAVDLEFKLKQGDAELARQREILAKRDTDLQESSEAIQILEAKLEEKQLLVLDAEEAMGLKENEARQAMGVVQKVKLLHAEHCKDLEQQIELLQQRLNNKTSQLAKVEGALSVVRHETQQKETQCDELQSALEEAQRRIKELDGREKKLKVIEEQASEGSKQVAELEVALEQCRHELSALTDKAEESRRDYDAALLESRKEVARKNAEIQELQAKQAVLEENVGDLRSSLAQRDEMLLSSQHRINSLEEGQVHAQKELSTLSHASAKDRSQREEEMTSLRRRCQQAEEALSQKISQIGSLDVALKEVHTELRKGMAAKQETEERLVAVADELQGTKERLAEVENALSKAMLGRSEAQEESTRMEKTAEELGAQLEDTRARCIDMESKVENAQQELQQTLIQLSELQRVLQESQNSTKEKERQVTELDRRLNVSEEELLLKEAVLRNHEKQLLSLDKLLKDKQQQLKDKTLQVVQLDMTLKEQRSELQEKVNFLDAELQKAQMELTEKAMEVSNLRSQVEQVQVKERDKDAKIKQLEKLVEQHNRILSEKSSQLLDLEKSVQIRNDLDSQLKVKTQEIVALKEEECQLRDEAQRLKMEVIQREHAQQSLLRELDQCHQMLAEKEADCARLARDLGSSQVREAQAEAKAVKEIRRISQQMEQQKRRQEQEVEQLQDRQTEEIAAREQELSRLRLALRRSEDEVTLRANDLLRYEQRLVENENDARETLRELQLQQEKGKDLADSLILKEAEVARLEAKISGYERATFGKVSHRTSQAQSQHATSKKEDSIFSPRPASVASFLGDNGLRRQKSKITRGSSSSLLVPDLATFPNSLPVTRHQRYSSRARTPDLSRPYESPRSDEEKQAISDGELTDALLDMTPPPDLGLTLNQSSL